MVVVGGADVLLTGFVVLLTGFEVLEGAVVEDGDVVVVVTFVELAVVLALDVVGPEPGTHWE